MYALGPPALAAKRMKATALTRVSRPVENTRPGASGDAPRKAAISVTDEAYAPELKGARALAFPRKFIQKKEQNRQAKACTGWFAEHCVGANSFARRH